MLNTGERYVPELDDDTISYEHWHRYLLAAEFVAGKAVLDIASGEGYGSSLLARTADRVVGVDVDPEAVAHARGKYPAQNLSFLQGSAEAIPIPGRHVLDVIVSFETLEHLPADGQRAFLAEAKRLLRADGLLVISTPNRDVFSGVGKAHNPFHLHEFSPDEFAAFLRGAFGHVRILNQRVYPGSYMWGGDAARGLTEYQLRFVAGQFQPVGEDLKAPKYLTAVCSDAPVPSAPTSLLIDLDGSPTGDSNRHVSTLFVDTGGGYGAGDRRSQRLPPGPGRFRVGFAVGRRGVRGVRWDPLELRTCRVRVDRVEWEDAGGAAHPVDPAAAATNGRPAGGGAVAFDTLDPMVFLPVAGDVARVTVEGWYEADDLPTSLATATAAADDARARACCLADQLRDRDQQALGLADQLRDRDAQFRAVADQLRERNEQVLALADQLREQDHHLRRLTEEASAMRARADALTAQVSELESQLGARIEQARLLTEELDAERNHHLTSTLFVDTGGGYGAGDRRSQRLPPGPGRFRVGFAVGRRGVRGVRWDPLELRTCRVRVDRVEWEDAGGAAHPVDPAAAATNGRPAGGGAVAFDTLDPMVFLPVAGDVARVTVEGWYEADDLPTSLATATGARPPGDTDPVVTTDACQVDAPPGG